MTLKVVIKYPIHGSTGTAKKAPWYQSVFVGFADHVGDRLEMVGEEMAEECVRDWSACAEGFYFQVERWVGVGDGVFDEVVATMIFHTHGGLRPPLSSCDGNC